MGLELALLIATTACSGLSALGIGWLILRLRSRGITASTAITKSSFGTLFDTVGHMHHFDQVDPAKYGDENYHCSEAGCGEPYPGKGK